MILSKRNWYNDPIMKRFLEGERLEATRKALNQLFEKGLIAFCPGGRVKLTPEMQKESWRLWA